MTDTQRLNFGFAIPVSAISKTLKWIAILNLVFLCGTWLHHSKVLFPDKKSVQLILVQFNFAKENVMAAWYSSMLFFCSGLLAAICFWADLKRSEDVKQKVFTWGWLAIAGIFIVLSFDEMGSFHEMIGETAMFKKAGAATGSKGAGWYVFYALIGIVALFMVTFFIMKFRTNKLALLLTILGVLLFVSNPFQEKFEIHSWRSSANPDQWVRPVFFLLLEEGSEIFASFCFLFSFATYAIGASSATGADGKPMFRINALLDKNILYYLLALAGLLGIVMLVIHFNAWNFKGDDNGIPHNWPPSATSFLGFAAALYVYFTAGQPRQYLLLLFAALLMSIYYGSNIYGYMHQKGLFSLLPYVMLLLVWITTGLGIKKLEPTVAKACMLGWAVFFTAGVFTSRFFPAAFGYLAAVSLVIALYFQYTALAGRQQR